MKKVLNAIFVTLMLVTLALTAYAIAAGGSEASISINLIWCYSLLFAAVACAVFGAIFSSLQSSSGGKTSFLSALLIVAVIVVAYFISASHTVQIPDIQNNGYFDRFPTVISETGILVTYVAFAATIVVTLVTEIWAALK